jgi:thiol-disulfide isomerase/thioredoxin
MKKIIIVALLMFLSWQGLYAQKLNQEVYDPALKRNVLVGACNRKAFLEGNFGIYYNSEYERYQPSELFINKLKEKINGVDIVVIYGEWCGDSKVQVPHFMKVIDKAGLPSVNLKIFAVNREKKAVITDLSKYNIERVPVFIVYQDGVELGRITETPKKTLEKDLWNIVKKAKSIKEEE